MTTSLPPKTKETVEISNISDFPSHSIKTLESLQETIRYYFGDRRLLLQALTHTSFGHEFLSNHPAHSRDNERMEFLGDAILDVIVSDILIEVFPTSAEGQLSKMRAALVNEKTLAEIAKNISLQHSVRLGKGEILTGGAEKPSILSSTLEALIAAIYLDGGFNAVYPIVRHLFAPAIYKDQLLVVYDPKTQLQEQVQARHKVTPTYHLINTSGPDHAKVFEVEVRMGGKILATSTGSSKKEAEQSAAREAILKLQTQ